ncbi:23S rRNA m(5)U1939 methyltransferase [Erysipelotrichaceae bacterium]|nr:23S rRNA m(5)U1939 methyltransferase [Erysipelotrichaceae bacterium]
MEMKIVECSGLNQMAKGICLDGKEKIFVEGLLPGEVAKVQIKKRNSKFTEAILIEITQKSPHRVDAECTIADVCGGCNLQHVSYDEQLKIKQNHAEMMMKIQDRQGEYDFKQIIGSPQRLQYRNKSFITFSYDAQHKIKPSFYIENSNDLVPFETCFVQTDNMNALTQAVAETLNYFDVPLYNRKSREGVLRHICVRENKAGDGLMLVFVVAKAEKKTFIQIAKAVQLRFPLVQSIYMNIQSHASGVLLGKKDVHLAGAEYLVDEVSGVEVNITPQAFFQVNPKQMEQLYEHVLTKMKLTKDVHLLDFYCGIGTMTLLTAKYVATAVGIDVVNSAIEMAKLNAIENGIENADFFGEDVEDFLENFEYTDVKELAAIIDPPRKGCTPEFLTQLGELGPKKIAYVSCNPTTLARDIVQLRAAGYTAGPIQFFDMFPQTMHVEAVVILEKR